MTGVVTVTSLFVFTAAVMFNGAGIAVAGVRLLGVGEGVDVCETGAEGPPDLRNGGFCGVVARTAGGLLPAFVPPEGARGTGFTGTLEV